MIVQDVLEAFEAFRQTGKLITLKNALVKAANGNMDALHSSVRELIASANLNDHERDVVYNLANQIDTRDTFYS